MGLSPFLKSAGSAVWRWSGRRAICKAVEKAECAAALDSCSVLLIYLMVWRGEKCPSPKWDQFLGLSVHTHPFTCPRLSHERPCCQPTRPHTWTGRESGAWAEGHAPDSCLTPTFSLTGVLASAISILAPVLQEVISDHSHIQGNPERENSQMTRNSLIQEGKRWAEDGCQVCASRHPPLSTVP